MTNEVIIWRRTSRAYDYMPQTVHYIVRLSEDVELWFYNDNEVRRSPGKLDFDKSTDWERL